MTPSLTRQRPDGSAEFVVTETLTMVKLARLCNEDACCYLQRPPYTQCFCLELFRRAVVERDDAAWAAVYTQYADTVRRWLALPPVEADEGVTRVFERFWQAVDAAAFARFPSLAAVLGYLKVCAYSVRVDRARHTRAAAAVCALDAAADRLPARDNVEEMVAGRLDAAGVWAVVRALLADEREGLVLYLSYVLGLSPREIRARHAARFPDVADVYRLKRNVLDRLRRAPEIQALALEAR